MANAVAMEDKYLSAWQLFTRLLSQRMKESRQHAPGTKRTMPRQSSALSAVESGPGTDTLIFHLCAGLQPAIGLVCHMIPGLTLGSEFEVSRIDRILTKNG